jgi:hypothetical protein
MDHDSRLKAALAPLEQALVAVAHEQARARLEQADGQTAATRERGASQVKTLLDHAAAEGAQAAERAARLRLVEAQRQARALVLGAERVAYDRLLAEAVSAARELRGCPEYADLERRLVDTVKVVLGPEAKITRDPDGRGGLQAQQGSRSVDLTLPALARRCVERLGGEVARLWS